MKKSVKYTLITIVCVLLFVIMAFVLILSGRVTKNPPGTVGNTAGNLYNEGLFCEYNGVVYFSNTSDGGSLYCMNPDETNVKLLQPQKVRNILAGGDYIYFFHSGASSKSGFGQVQGMKSFARCKQNGKDFKSLSSEVVVSAQLVDDYLYLLTTSNSGPAFLKMNTDQSDQKLLTNDPIDPACAKDGKIYYNGVTSDHYLYCLETTSDVVSDVWHGDLWFPVLDGDYVYYLDVANHYRLCRYSLYAHEINVLTNERVECFNVGGGYIYYQTNSKNPALKCMYTDGSGQLTVAEGNYTNINLTSRYAYFQPFGNENTTYHSPLGSTGVSTFIPISK